MTNPVFNSTIAIIAIALLLPTPVYAQPTFTTEQPGSAIIIRTSNPSSDEYSCVYDFEVAWSTYGTQNRQRRNRETRVAPQANNAIFFHEQGYATDLHVVGGRPSIQCNVIIKPKPQGDKQPTPTPPPSPSPSPAPIPTPVASSCIAFDGGESTPFGRNATLYVRNSCTGCVVFDAVFVSSDGRPWARPNPTIVTVKARPGRTRYDYAYDENWPYSGRDWVAWLKPKLMSASYNCNAIP